MERGKGKKKDKGKEPEKGKEDKEKRKEAEKERTKDKGKGKDKRKESKEEDKRKGSKEEDKRKGSKEEDKRKGSKEENKKKENKEEDKRKESKEEEESKEEDKRKESKEEDKKKESQEEDKKKESKEEEERKESKEDKKKESKEEDKKKESKEEEESKEEDKRKERETEKEKERVKEEDRRVLGKPVLEPPPEKKNHILVLGLDGAGKTSVLYSLALNRIQHSEAPTQGFLEVCINTEHCQMEFLEIGGSEPFRSYWEMYVSRGMLLIFVVDSADHRRLPEAKKCLHRLIKINPCIPLVVFANKQDLKTAYRITDIHEALALSDVGNDRMMFLFGTQVTENGSEIPSSMQDAKDLIAHLAAHRQ